MYTSYIEKAQETVGDQYLSEVVHAAQLYAAEKGLELHSIAIAPKVDADNKQGVELFLTETERVADLSDLYAMIGSHTFKDADTTNLHYYNAETPKADETKPECTHEFSIEGGKPATCVEDGFEKCKYCESTKVIPATGHTPGGSPLLVANLKIYACAHGCGYKVVVPDGNLIGGKS